MYIYINIHRRPVMYYMDYWNFDTTITHVQQFYDTLHGRTVPQRYTCRPTEKE